MAVKVLVIEPIRNRVLGDRCVRRDVGEPVAVEELKASVANHSHGQAGGSPAVEDLADSCPHSS